MTYPAVVGLSHQQINIQYMYILVCVCVVVVVRLLFILLFLTRRITHHILLHTSYII
jgi:hypothetical protein